MKIRKIIKRIASAAMAIAIGATTIAASFSSGITAKAANDTFSIRVSKDNYGFWHYTGFPELESGISAFCYNYGKHAWTGDTYTESDVSYNYLTELYLGYVQYYGYPNADTSDAYYGATQCLVWEILGGYRTLDNSFALKGAGYKGLIWSQVQKKAYDDIVKRVQNHHSAMSCANGTFTLKYNPAKRRYETVITDNNALGGAFNFVTKLRSEGFTVEQNDSKHYTVATTSQIASAKSVSFQKNIPYRYKKTSVTYVCAGTINGTPTRDNQIMGLENSIDPVQMRISLVTEKTGNFSFKKRFLNRENRPQEESIAKQMYSSVTFNLVDNATGENVYLRGSNGSYTFAALNHTAGFDYTGTTAVINVNADNGKCSVSNLPVGNYTLVEKTTYAGYLCSANVTVSIKAGQTVDKTVDNKTTTPYKSVTVAKHWIDENGNDYCTSDADSYKALVELFKDKNDTSDNAWTNAWLATNDFLNTVKLRAYVLIDGEKYYISEGGLESYLSDGIEFTGFTVCNEKGESSVLMGAGTMAGFCKDVTHAKELYFDTFGGGDTGYVNWNGEVGSTPNITVYGLTKNTSKLLNTEYSHTCTQIGVNGETDGKIYFEEIACDKTYAAVSFNMDSVDPVDVDYTATSGIANIYNYKRVFPLNVVKKDSITGAAVQGARYGLYNATTNELVDEGTTDANGSITFENLAVDKTYYVKEIEAPSNYMIDPEKHEVKFKGSLDGLALTQRVLDEQELDVKETPKLADLNILKKDNLGNIVANVSFDVITNQNIKYNDKTYNKGDVVATLKTDINGKAEIKDLPLGEYKVKETGTYQPYVVTNEEQVVLFEGAEVAPTVKYVSKTLEFTNYIQKGKLTIKKVATFDNNKTLAGAEFTVTAAEDFVVNGHKIHSKGNVIATLTTDENGIATNYKEVDVTVDEIPMYANAKYTVTETKAPEGYTLNNTPQTFVMEWDDTPELQYVSTTQVFDNDETKGSINVQKRTEGNLNVKGIKFTLTGTSAQGNVITRSAETDDKGNALFTQIPVGSAYEIVEDGDTVPTAYLVAESKDNVKVEYAKTTNVEFYNEEKTGTISVKKHTKGDLNISGITFTLKGTSQSNREITITANTDDKGIATFEKIPIGVYTIYESDNVPAAYLIAEPKKDVRVEYAKTTNVEFTNEEKTGSIKLQKRTEGNLNISDISFTLKGTAQTGEYVEISAKTDDKGVATFENIPIGSAYEIVEDGDTVPTAYLVAESKKDVKVEYAKTTDVEFYNQHKTGSIKIQKSTSDNSDKINNIKFVLSGKADCGLDVEINATTDDKGVATFENVPIGTFEIVEDGKTVPVGYLVADKQSVKVEYAKTTDVTFTNKPTEIEFSKQSATGSGELEGAKLQLFDEKGKLVEEWTSGTNPHVIKGKLAAGGKYRLHESLAPIGYKVASDIEFTVNTDGKVQKVVMYDEAEEKPERPPQTGYTEHNPMVFVLLAGIALISVFSIFVKVSSKKKEDE